MILKFALTEPCLVQQITGKQNEIMIKTASGRVLIEPGSEKEKIVQAEIKKHPNSLFFRAKAIKADEPNSNGDSFSKEELLKGYKSFEGVPFFTNHENQDIEKAKGKIIFAEWDEKESSIYTIAFVDRDAYPHICRGIEQGYMSGVSMGSINGESKITMSDLSTKKISDISIGDKVITPYGNIETVEKTYSGKLNVPMRKFKLGSYHKSPWFSPEHPILTIKKEDVSFQRKKYERMSRNNYFKRKRNTEHNFVSRSGWRDFQFESNFIESENVNVGDYLLIPSKYNLVEDSDYNSDLFYLLGAYIGDGYVSKNKKGYINSLSYYIGLHEKKELGEKLNCLLKNFTDKRIVNSEYPEKSGLNISTYDSELAEIMFSMAKSNAHHKRIIKKDFTKKEICQLVSGYIDTDGSIVKSYGKKINGEIRGNGIRGVLLFSCNEELLEDVQSLLILLGVKSSIKFTDREPNKNSLVSVPTTDYSLFIPYSYIHLFKEYSIKIKNIDSELLSNADAGHSFIYKNKGNNYIAVPVKEILVDESFSETSYDIKVSNDECYIADGVAIHNCSVEYSVCSICENRAERTEDYCSHIRDRKSRKFTGKARNVRTGNIKEFKDEPVFEHNYGIKFIELSGVVDPACSSCHIQGIIPNNDYLGKVANIENSLRMVKTSAIEKNASQEELDQINQVLQTLEDIAINLIKNRQQVEVEFASELVDLISKLQTWNEELVGAGYGNMQGNVPGTYEGDGMDNTTGEVPMEETPMEDQTGGLATSPRNETIPASPVASQQAMEVGQTTGAPGKSLINSPQMPITAPMRPSATSSHLIRRVADEVVNRYDLGNSVLQKAASLCGEMNKTGGKIMGKRRTVASKEEQKEKTIKVLSSSWQEKQNFFEYIKEVPSMQIGNIKLSIKNRDDSFVVVAEDNSSNKIQIWTYEDFSDDDKKLISESPRDAAYRFLDLFAKNTNQIKEGVERMSKETKEAGANTVLATPEVITERQLSDNTSELYHGRTGEEQQVITQKQLDGSIAYPRKGEQEVLTENQLNNSDLKLNPRQKTEPQVVTEAQLRNNSGASPRKEEDKHTITQDQLDREGYRTGTEQEVITEKQLSGIDAPWARQSSRNASMFKSAKEHMNAVVEAFAEVSLETGATPKELQEIASVSVASTKARVKLAEALLTEVETHKILPFTQRVSYWNSKNVRVATASTADVEYSLVDKLRVIASDVTINPDVIIDAIDVLSDGELGEQSISRKVDEKLAQASNKATKVNLKDELRNALKQAATEEKCEECEECECDPCECKNEKEASSNNDIVDTEEEEKIQRDVEREEILASLKSRKKVTASKNEILNPEKLNGADIVIETSFSEVGTKKAASTFRKDIVKYAKSALATENMKLASITNVTIDGNTIQIAVQTDSGSESVSIPIGEEIAPVEQEVVPEGDLAGEGLENDLGGDFEMENANSLAFNKNRMKRSAQSPMGGGMGGAGGGVSAPGAPEAGLDAPPVGGDTALQALTTGDEQMNEEIPTVGEKQAPWSICPECGSSDVDVTREDDGGIIGGCNACGAEYEALVKKTIEFKIIKPTVSVGEEGGEVPEAPEGPEEVPALPVAAQTRIDKNSIVRIASNRKANGDVCPSCGNKKCDVIASGQGTTKCKCGKCGVGFEKNLLISSTNPSQGYLRVEWDVSPDNSCPECRKEARKFASTLKIAKMLRTASKNADQFPTANCVERIARTYGGNTVAKFGPCKGKSLASCVCKELKKLGFTKVRQLNKFAETSMQLDPMDACIADQKKKGHNVIEASSICNCIKKKFASETDDNIYKQAFADEAKTGKIELTSYDLSTLDNMFKEEKAYFARKAQAILEEVDISDDLEPLDSIDVDIDEVAEEPEMETSSESVTVEITGDNISVNVIDEEIENDEIEEEVDFGNEVEEVEGDMDALDTDALADALAMTSSRVRRSGAESNIKLAGKPKVVKTIENDVKAGVPRGNATIRNESADNIDVKMANPSVPRGNATMGHEGADNINVPAGLPDVAVDSSYMGVEKQIQQDMPAINNEIKGTVIAKGDKTRKQAKQMKEIDTVEKDVKSGVPRSKATMGHEGADNIDVKMSNPNIPRSKATMGNEGADNIDVSMTGPDVPVDSAYMGVEKEIQKDMPGINNEILKQVQMKRDQQLERIASARREEALRTTAWLAANGRISSDKSTFDNVVTALATFEVDKIASAADQMFPVIIKTASTQNVVRTAGTGLPAIVISSQPSQEKSFGDKLAGAFTIGSNLLNNKLINDNER